MEAQPNWPIRVRRPANAVPGAKARLIPAVESTDGLAITGQSGPKDVTKSSAPELRTCKLWKPGLESYLRDIPWVHHRTDPREAVAAGKSETGLVWGHGSFSCP